MRRQARFAHSFSKRGSRRWTYIEGRFFHKTQFWKGRKAFILTHEDAATQNLFGMAKRFQDKMRQHSGKRTLATGRATLAFAGLMSVSPWGAGSAEKRSGAERAVVPWLRGGCWPNAEEHAKGIGQTVASEPGTEIILESTANGIGGDFHERWQAAEAGTSEYIAVFVPWFWTDQLPIAGA